MGSFNVTCFATQQTIAEGERCRVVAIGQSSTFRPVRLKDDGLESEQYGIANSTVYADCFWKPQTGFIPAVYKDFGRVELQLTPYFRQMLVYFLADVLANSPVVLPKVDRPDEGSFDFEAFLGKGDTPMLAALLLEQRRGMTLPEGGLAEADAEISKCWDFIWETAREHRLFLRTYANVQRPLQFAIVHEHTYQALIETVASGRNWEKESLAQVDFLGRCLVSAQAEKEEWLAKDKLESRDQADMGGWYLSNGMQAALSRADSNSSYPRRTADGLVRVAMAKFAKGELTEADVLAKLEPMVSDRYAMSALNSFNLKFSPVIYAGQDYDNAIGRSFLKFASRVSEKVCKDRDADR